MDKLKELVVSENRLVGLPDEVSGHCTLEHLDVHSNNLTGLPASLLASTSK